MARGFDIIYKTEYLKDVLYFAIVKQGKILKNTADTHYFSIDEELVYENYYSDFGPLNLGCVYKYCAILNEKLKKFINKQAIVHYTSIEPKKKANAAFLLGCFGVLYLSLQPRDALKPLMLYGQTYRPFQDATQGDSLYTISLLDCLNAIKKARELGFFDFQDFNYEEYNRLDKIQGGDLNWIIPGKFLAFIGPVDYSVALYHPPDMYIDYFLENNVKVVIRLNKKFYDGNVFRNAGIAHIDLIFPDGSCPPRHILFKFLSISEESNDAIAVHCKAGLGRTGSLIGCYLIKHYRMTAREAIGWMRICRPGSVIGHQQGWLQDLEAWLTKQGNLYRKRMYQNMDRFPTHQFGVYSVAEQMLRQRPVVLSRSPSPPLPMHKHTRSDISPPVRPQASKVREDNEEESKSSTTSIESESDRNESIKTEIQIAQQCKDNVTYGASENISSISSRYSRNSCKELCWKMAVCCLNIVPKSCHTSMICTCLDLAAPKKALEKEYYSNLSPSNGSNDTYLHTKIDARNASKTLVRRGSVGAGEPRTARAEQNKSQVRPTTRSTVKSNDFNAKNLTGFHPMPPFRGTQNVIIRNMNDARNYLMKSNIHSEETRRSLNSAITVTPQQSLKKNSINQNFPRVSSPIPSSYSTGTPLASRASGNRRRLGRSPSPPPLLHAVVERSRATNTPPQPPPTIDKSLIKATSRSTLRESISGLLSNLQLQPRGPPAFGAGSVGAASMGGRRLHPATLAAPSVRSDERPLATQGDMLNSIKMQRRMRETLHMERQTTISTSGQSKEKTGIRNDSKLVITKPKTGYPMHSDLSTARERIGSSNSTRFQYNVTNLKTPSKSTRNNLNH